MIDEQPKEQQPEAQPATRRVNKRRVARHGLRAMAILLLAPISFALIAFALIIDRDISAPSWIKTRVSERADLALAGGKLSFGDVTVNIGRDLHPRVRMQDVQVFDADGARLAAVAQVSALMSPRGLLFERAALMQNITLSGTQIALRRNRDGSVALSFDLEAEVVSEATTLVGLLDQVDAVFEQPALAALEQVAVTDLVINYADARAGRLWTVDGGTVALDLRGDQTQLNGEAFVLSGATVTEMALRYASPRGERRAEIAIDIIDAQARDLATQSAALNWLAALDAPLSAALSTELDAQGGLGPLRVALNLGQGTVQPGGDATPVGFESAATTLRYEPQRDRIAFESFDISSDWGRIKGRGQALAREITDGLPGALLGQFTFHDLALNPMGLYPDAVPITDAAVDFRLRLDPLRIEIGQAVLSGASFAMTADGVLRADPDGWNVALDAGIGQISYDDVRAVWPDGFKPGTRKWFFNNALRGEVRDLVLGFRRSPGAEAQLAMGFGFAETELTMLRNLPPLAAARGTASLIDNRFVVALEQGTVRAPTGGAVDMSGAVISIADTRVSPGRLTMDMAAKGTITAVLSLLDQPPFEYMTKAGRPVTIADGRATVSGQISWFAKPKQDPGDVQFDVAADLRRLRSDQVVPGRTLAASQARVRINNERLEIAGDATLDGVPVNATWTRRIGQDVSGSEVVANVEISPRFLDAFNIALPPGSLSGRGRGDVVLDLRDGRPPNFSLVSDLRGIGLAVAPIGWAKPPSTRGNLFVTGALSTPPRIDRIEVSGGGLSAVGRLTLTPAGGLDNARFDQLQVGNWLNAPMTLRGRGRGAPVAVSIGGGVVDLRNARFDQQGGESGPSEIALDRLQLTDGIALNNFRGSFTGQGGFSGQFRGQVNDGPQVQGTVVPQDGRSAIRLISDDAGGLARAAGLIENATGGSMDLTLRPARGEGTFDGVLAVRGLRIRDAPAIAALLDAISVVGLLQQLDGQGLSFDEVDATFQLTPRAVQIAEASAVGPGLGISLDGTYMLASKQLDLRGVISPLYLINSIGSVLTRKGEGLIGFNYSVTGTAASPDVNVNPLSALTPGMFREIFRSPPPEVTP